MIVPSEVRPKSLSVHGGKWMIGAQDFKSGGIEFRIQTNGTSLAQKKL
jgi:hypothetical protein